MDENDPKVEQAISDVMAEERSRGRRRRPLDLEEKRRATRLRADLVRALRIKDEREFLRLLRESGWKDESPEFANALKCFRAALGKV